MSPDRPYRAKTTPRRANLLAAVWIGLAVPAWAQVNIERLRRDDDARGLAGSANIAFSVRTGNVDLVQLNLGGRIDYIGAQVTTLVLGQGDVGFASGERFANEMLLHVRQVYGRPDRPIRPEAFVQANYDRARSLTSRAIAGGGVRLRVYQSPRIRLVWGSGYMVEVERLDLAATARHPDRTTEHRWTNYLSARLVLGAQAVLTSISYVQPSLEDFGDSRVLSETRLGVDINERLALVLTFDARYDSRPPDEVESLDTATRTGLNVRF